MIATIFTDVPFQSIRRRLKSTKSALINNAYVKIIRRVLPSAGMTTLGLILTLFSMNALADANRTLPKQLVDATTLHLVGRGIKVKKTGEGLNLACLDSECTQLRFVYFKNQKEAYYFGDILLAPIAASADLKQKALKVLVKDFFYSHHTLSSAEHIDRGMQQNGFLIIAGATAIAFAIPSGGLSLGLTMAGSITAGLLLASSDAMNSMTSGIGNTATLNDTQGWSWSENPKSAKAHVFYSLLDRIQNGTRMSLYANQVFGSYDRDDKLEHKIYRERARLIEMGVVFQPNKWGF